MKNSSKFASTLAIALVMAATSANAQAGVITDAISGVTAAATEMGPGYAAILTIAVAIVGLKLGKRLLGKV